MTRHLRQKTHLQMADIQLKQYTWSLNWSLESIKSFVAVSIKILLECWVRKYAFCNLKKPRVSCSKLLKCTLIQQSLSLATVTCCQNIVLCMAVNAFNGTVSKSLFSLLELNVDPNKPQLLTVRFTSTKNKNSIVYFWRIYSIFLLDNNMEESLDISLVVPLLLLILEVGLHLQKRHPTLWQLKQVHINRSFCSCSFWAS